MASCTPYQNKTVLIIWTKPYSLSERTRYWNSRLISEQFVPITITRPVLVIRTIVPITSTNWSIYPNKCFVPITNRTRYKCSHNETLVYTQKIDLILLCNTFLHYGLLYMVNGAVSWTLRYCYTRPTLDEVSAST